MIEGMISEDDQLSDSELETKLGELISKGHSLSLVISLKNWIMSHFIQLSSRNHRFFLPIT